MARYYKATFPSFGRQLVRPVPTTKRRHYVSFPEAVLLVGAKRDSVIVTDSMSVCHAVALGGINRCRNEGALYLSHAYPTYDEETLQALDRVLDYMLNKEIEPVFAATLGPADALLGSAKYLPCELFESTIARRIGEVVRGVNVSLDTYIYHGGAANGFDLAFTPAGDNAFTATHRDVHKTPVVGSLKVDESPAASPDNAMM